MVGVIRVWFLEMKEVIQSHGWDIVKVLIPIGPLLGTVPKSVKNLNQKNSF